MKLYKYYTKWPYSFLVNYKLCHQIIPYDLWETCSKKDFSEKSKTIDNKIEQNKAQYDYDRQMTKISAVSLGNVIYF